MLHTLPQAAVLAMKENSWTWHWNTPLLPHVLTMGHNSSDTDTTINSVWSVINMYRYSVLEHWCLMHDFEYNCQAIRFEHDWLCGSVFVNFTRPCSLVHESKRGGWQQAISTGVRISHYPWFPCVPLLYDRGCSGVLFLPGADGMKPATGSISSQLLLHPGHSCTEHSSSQR